MPNSGFLFIPVDTGNTFCTSHHLPFRSVHPRGYGEHGDLTLAVNSPCGSSPWIRGTQIIVGVIFLAWRFIPVDTGNTPAQITESDKLTVHPRGYGEHKSLWVLYFLPGGSSPWIRGTLPRKSQSQIS